MKKQDFQTLALIVFALLFYSSAIYSAVIKDFTALILSGMLCILFAGLSVYQVIKN